MHLFQQNNSNCQKVNNTHVHFFVFELVTQSYPLHKQRTAFMCRLKDIDIKVKVKQLIFDEIVV